MQQSANYSLKLMEGTDNVKRQDFVDNFTNIDSQMKIINDNSYPNVTATGTNAYVGSIDRIKSLGKGTKLTLFVGTDATSNCSLNLNSYGVKNIKDSFGNIVTNLKATIPYNLCYNGTDFILQGKGGGGNATAAQIIKGATATVDSGPVTGTLDLINLVTANIKSGVTINGVAGSGTVVDTADAVLDPQYLLTGYSGYDDGVKKAGTMPNLSGNWQSGALMGTYNSGNGYAPLIQIPRGYSDGGVNTYSFCVDANFVPSNIVSGKSIFGLAGSATVSSIGGANYATGSILPPVYSATLNFTPKIVIINQGGRLYLVLNNSFGFPTCLISDLRSTLDKSVLFLYSNITSYLQGNTIVMWADAFWAFG